MIANTSFRNSSILHDCLNLGAPDCDRFREEHQDKYKTDDLGNITHLLGDEVIEPVRDGAPCQWYERKGVPYEDSPRLTLAQWGALNKLKRT